jgi:hypothetical protein
MIANRAGSAIFSEFFEQRNDRRFPDQPATASWSIVTAGNMRSGSLRYVQLVVVAVDHGALLRRGIAAADQHS